MAIKGQKFRPKFDQQTVLRAIENSGGIVSVVAERLSCSWATARKYIDKWEETRRAYEDERQRIVDMAETTILRAVREGDVKAAQWVLSRLGRDRGWGDHVEVSGRQVIDVVIEWPDKPATGDDDGDD